jgi:hypothetical protein
MKDIFVMNRVGRRRALSKAKSGAKATFFTDIRRTRYFYQPNLQSAFRAIGFVDNIPI